MSAPISTTTFTFLTLGISSITNLAFYAANQFTPDFNHKAMITSITNLAFYAANQFTPDFNNKAMIIGAMLNCTALYGIAILKEKQRRKPTEQAFLGYVTPHLALLKSINSAIMDHTNDGVETKDDVKLRVSLSQDDLTILREMPNNKMSKKASNLIQNQDIKAGDNIELTAPLATFKKLASALCDDIMQKAEQENAFDGATTRRLRTSTTQVSTTEKMEANRRIGICKALESKLAQRQLADTKNITSKYHVKRFAKLCLSALSVVGACSIATSKLDISMTAPVIAAIATVAAPLVNYIVEERLVNPIFERPLHLSGR